MENNKQNMKTLPESERPYERCMKYGAEVLTDAQLLAVILKSGSKEESAIELAHQLLNHNDMGNGILGLSHMKLPDFMKYRGIGKVKAVTLLCLVEFSKRLAKSHKMDSISFNDSSSVAEFYMDTLKYYEQEHFIVMLLDSKNRLIKEKEMSIGAINASLASTREIMIEALRYEAVHFIVVHNHPSGDTTPSTADLAITKKLIEAGNLMDITLLDHIIIGDGKYTSICSVMGYNN